MHHVGIFCIGADTVCGLVGYRPEEVLLLEIEKEGAKRKDRYGLRFGTYVHCL